MLQESGVKFHINGKDVTLRGALTVASGDNLASQLIGGFKALNSALRRCRYCMATNDDVQTKVSATILFNLL